MFTARDALGHVPRVGEVRLKTDSESTDATRKRPKRRRGSGNRAARQRKRADSSRGSTRAAHGDGPGLSRGRSRSSKAIRTGGAQGAQGSSGCAASETPGCPDDLGLRVGSADRTSTRERLVDAAMTLFRGRGYEGTGLAGPDPGTGRCQQRQPLPLLRRQGATPAGRA